jgi:hypothetical protein
MTRRSWVGLPLAYVFVYVATSTEIFVGRNVLFLDRICTDVCLTACLLESSRGKLASGMDCHLPITHDNRTYCPISYVLVSLCPIKRNQSRMELWVKFRTFVRALSQISQQIYCVSARGGL